MSDQNTQVVNLQNTEQTKAAPAAAVAVEPPAASPPPQTDEMRSKFAALAKKERIARLAQHNLKTQQQQLAERERIIAEREQAWDSEFKRSPLEAIKKRGYSFEDLQKAALNDGRFEPETEIKTVRGEIERLRQEQVERDKKQLEAQQLAAQQFEQETIDNFKEKINQTIEANSEKYELAKLYDASDLVFQTVEEHFERTKKVLSVDEALGLVEQYLEGEIERTAKSSKKFQAKYGQTKPKEEPSSKPKSDVTLSNNLTSTSASLLPAHTDNDRMKRALAALGQ